MNRNRYEPEPGFKDLGLNRTEPNRTVGLMDLSNSPIIASCNKVRLCDFPKNNQLDIKPDNWLDCQTAGTNFHSEYSAQSPR